MRTGRVPLLTRRDLVSGGVGLAALVAVGGGAACSRSSRGTLVAPGSAAVEAAEKARRMPGRSTATDRLTPRPVTLDIGVRTVQTWAYGDQHPGPHQQPQQAGPRRRRRR